MVNQEQETYVQLNESNKGGNMEPAKEPAKMIVCRSCGSVDDYQIIEKNGQKTAWCKSCDSWIKNIPYSEPSLWFGKYSGTPVNDIADLSYMEWLIKNDVVKPGRIRRAIIERVEELKVVKV